MQENIAVISLKNIVHNFSVFRRLAGGAKVCAVVKADAYGHGAERVAESLEGYADGFAVTSVKEGIALRIAGIRKPIWVLTAPLAEDDVFLALAHGLTLTVCSFSSLRVLADGAEKCGQIAPVHVKINTGMNRLGLSGAPLARLFAAIARRQSVRVQGVYSHLYAPADAAAAEGQRARFEAAAALAQDRFGPVVRHLSATGGILRGEAYRFDGVRPGIGIYGYLPGGFGAPRSLGLRPAMRLYTHVLQSRRFAGGGVGYERAAREYGDLTACRLGYADGFLRAGGGGRLKAVGKLCMDGCIREGRAKFAARRTVFLSAEEVAKEAGTISYEVLCAAAKRAVRVYVES